MNDCLDEAVRKDVQHPRRIYRTVGMKRVMLYFGSFNPIHKGHTALAEYVLGSVSATRPFSSYRPRSPYKQAGNWLPSWTVSRWPRSPAPILEIPGKHQAFGRRVPASETFIYNRYAPLPRRELRVGGAVLDPDGQRPDRAPRGMEGVRTNPRIPGLRLPAARCREERFRRDGSRR